MWYQVHLRPVYTFRQPPSEAHGVYSQFESSVEKSSAVELWSAQDNLWYDFCGLFLLSILYLYHISLLIWCRVDLRLVYTFIQSVSETYSLSELFTPISNAAWRAVVNCDPLRLNCDTTSVAINQRSCLILKTTHIDPLSKRYSALCRTYPDKMWLFTWLTFVMHRHRMMRVLT